MAAAVAQNVIHQVSGSLGQYIPQGTLPIFLIVAILAVIVGVAIWIGTRSTPASALQTQKITYRSTFDSLAQARKGVNDYLAQADVVKSKTNWVLLNFDPLTLYNAGYNGPLAANGYYDTATIRQALDVGFRAFVFNIDFYEGAPKDSKLFVPPGDPCLLARDELDVIRSANCGRIQDMMTALDTQAFSSGLPTGNDPLLVFLDFKHTPDSVQSPSAYKLFLQKVSKQIQPLRKHLLTNLGESRFTNLTNQNLLFTQNFQSFRGKTLVFTNVNTDIFLQGGGQMEENLRLMIHAQMFKSGSADIVPGDTITNATPKGTLPPILKQTPSFFLQTPAEQATDAQSKTNNVYTFVSLTDIRTNLPDADRTALRTQYGAQVIPFHLYESPAIAEKFLNDWGVWSWKIKPVPLQYVVVMAQPPKTISPAANANQGKITAPSLVL